MCVFFVSGVCVCVCVYEITKTSAVIMITLDSFNLFLIFSQRTFLDRYRNSTLTHIVLQKEARDSHLESILCLQATTQIKKSIGPG